LLKLLLIRQKLLLHNAQFYHHHALQAFILILMEIVYLMLVFLKLQHMENKLAHLV